MKRQAIIHVEGLVQRGGFRDKVQEKAFMLGLTGQAENLPDSSVRITCEGEPGLIRKLRRAIRGFQPPIHVTGIRTRYRPCTGKFPRFDVVPDKDPAKAGDERAGQAIHLLTEVLDVMRSVDRNTTRTNHQACSMDRHLCGMDRNVGRRFDRLDRSYGSFGKTLKTVSKDMKGLKRPMESMDRSSRAMASDVRSLRKAATAGRRRPRKPAAASV